MKFIVALFCFALLSLPGLSQESSHFEGGKAMPYKQSTPCISPAEYKMVDSVIRHNLKLLKYKKKHKSLQSGVTFDFPMVYSGSDCRYYNVSNYVDQNTASGSIQDYNCGSITYDGHLGTDLYIWPFDFWKMDSGQVDIVAAANGTIIAKDDGHYDRNCAMGNTLANYVILLHSDGSTSWYWHMKSGSVTSLPIGSVVTVGTYLGKVGSSGSSTGPHLHFEVHTGNGSNTPVIDPFYKTGGCNLLNNSSWWNNQIAYYEGQLAAVSTHLHPIQFQACPTTTPPAKNTCFRTVTDTVFIYLFGYNSNNNGPTLTIKRPNGTVYYTTGTGSTTYNGFYYYWYFIFPNGSPTGVWTVTGTFNSQSCSTEFYLGNPAATINASICADSSYFFNGTNLNNSGTYLDTLSNAYGCDSVVTLNLTVNALTFPIVDGGAGTWNWQGGQNTNWFNRCNWDKGTLPNLLSDVVIPGSTPRNPTITGAAANCRTLTVNTTNGGKVTIDTSAGGVLNVDQ